MIIRCNLSVKEIVCGAFVGAFVGAAGEIKDKVLDVKDKVSGVAKKVLEAVKNFAVEHKEAFKAAAVAISLTIACVGITALSLFVIPMLSMPAILLGGLSIPIAMVIGIIIYLNTAEESPEIK